MVFLTKWLNIDGRLLSFEKRCFGFVFEFLIWTLNFNDVWFLYCFWIFVFLDFACTVCLLCNVLMDCTFEIYVSQIDKKGLEFRRLKIEIIKIENVFEFKFLMRIGKKYSSPQYPFPSLFFQCFHQNVLDTIKCLKFSITIILHDQKFLMKYGYYKLKM